MAYTLYAIGARHTLYDMIFSNYKWGVPWNAFPEITNNNVVHVWVKSTKYNLQRHYEFRHEGIYLFNC